MASPSLGNECHWFRHQQGYAAILTLIHNFLKFLISTLNPICRQKKNRVDAVTVRSLPEKVAIFISSSNSCTKEGLVRAGFTCNVVYHLEDNVVRKYTVCASTGDEAWSYSTLICKDAAPPDKSFFPPSKVCIADGQTPCE